MYDKREIQNHGKGTPQTISKRDRERKSNRIFEDETVLVDAIGFRMSKNEVGHIK